MRGLILAICLLVSGPAVFAASSPDKNVSFTIAGLYADQVLDVYRVISGKTVVVSPEVKNSKTPVDVKARGVTKEAALRLIEAALRQQASVEIVCLPDGTLSARKLTSRE